MIFRIGDKAARLIGISPILPEILFGLLLSPSVAGLMPKPYAECQHKDDFQCSDDAVFNAILFGGPDHKLNGLLRDRELCQDERLSWEHHVHNGTLGSDDGNLSILSHSDCAILQDGLSGIRGGDEDMLNACGAFNKLVVCAQDKCKAEINYLCSWEPDVFTMLGRAGLSLMVFESGMRFDPHKFAQSDIMCWSVLAPFLCICSATSSGIVMTTFLRFRDGTPPEDMFLPGLAVGLAFGPTSAGVAMKLLA